MAHDRAGPAANGSPDRGAPARDPTERLLWALMREFETLALDRYEAHAPLLATDEKRRFVADLRPLEVDRGTLDGSALATPVEELLARARTTDEASVLLVQGLVLEHLGQAIYGVAERVERASPATRSLAAEGRRAGASVTALACGRIPECVGRGDQLYAVFIDATYEVLAALDGLAEPVDEIFGERFGLRFADVLGEFAADLIQACVALGMPRRKVVAHLAGACMGL